MAGHFPPQYDLNDQFMSQHYLAGLLLSDIRLCIELTENGQPAMQKAMLYALTALKQLMTAHDVDPRANRHPQVVISFLLE